MRDKDREWNWSSGLVARLTVGRCPWIDFSFDQLFRLCGIAVRIWARKNVRFDCNKRNKSVACLAQLPMSNVDSTDVRRRINDNVTLQNNTQTANPSKYNFYPFIFHLLFFSVQLRFSILIFSHCHLSKHLKMNHNLKTNCDWTFLSSLTLKVKFMILSTIMEHLFWASLI